MSKFDMNKLMQQAQQMQSQMQQAQEEAANEVVEASAGGGMVTVKATGGGEIVSIEIDPKAIDPDDPEMLSDLILAAVNEALRSANALMESKMQGMIPGGLGGLGSRVCESPGRHSGPFRGVRAMGIRFRGCPSCASLTQRREPLARRQRLGAELLLEPAERGRLELADPLARQPELLADLLQAGSSSPCTKPKRSSRTSRSRSGRSASARGCAAARARSPSSIGFSSGATGEEIADSPSPSPIVWFSEVDASTVSSAS